MTDVGRVDALRGELATRFRRVAEEGGPAVRGARPDEEGQYPGAVWQALREGGVIGAPIAEEFGGLGMGLRGLAMVLEEMAAADIGDMMPILSTMAALPIATHGSEELKRAVLPDVASGKTRLAFAVTERAAGSNVFAAATEAARSGDHYVLNGEKHYISGVDHADAILLLARTKSIEACLGEGLEESAGLSLFLVDRDAPGLSWMQMSLPRFRSVAQYQLRLDDVRVPASRLVGARGFAVVPVLEALNVERILIPALVVGATRWALEIAIEHAKERRVFGEVPLGRYQAVQHPLAEAYLRLQGLRALLDEATGHYDGGSDPLTVSLPTAAARFAAVEVAETTLHAVGQALGTRGLEPDIGLLGFSQMVQLFKAAPVSTPVLLNFVAEHHLGLPRSS